MTPSPPATVPTVSDPGAEPDRRSNELLAALWEHHHGTNVKRVATLEAAALALLDGDLPATLRDDARNVAHKLAGSLGTFGFHDGTAVARRAEALLDDDTPDAKILSECVVALLEIVGVETKSHATRDEGAVPYDPDAEAPGEHVEGINDVAQDEPDPTDASRIERDEVLLITSDPELLERLQIAVAARGSSLLCPRTASETEAMLRTGRVAAALVDLELGHDYGATLLAGVTRAHPAEVRTFGLSATDTFEARMRVARAGGDGFISRSVPGQRLLETVDGRAWRRVAAVATVAALDDDPLQLSLLGALLSGSTFNLVSCSDPARLWEILEQDSPAAVLLDLQMPDVDGLVMCRAIRAEPRWLQLPILFLTAHIDDSSMRAMFAAGADDYLPKPLNGAELVARLSNHVARHQLQSTITGTDSLTGASNRGLSEQRLSQLLRLAARRAEPVSVAIVRVDGFARINRRAGQRTGDTILRTVAGLLGEHLRDDDVIGRWDGETFVLGLYGAETDRTVERLVALVDELSQQPFVDVAGRRLAVTFSAGVAEFPVDRTDLLDLIGVADEALQRSGGRPGTVRSARSSGHTDAGLAQADVVVVDDDRILAELLVHSVETAGYVVRHIHDGIEAAELLGNGLLRARLVLLDVGLPGMDGFSLLRVLRDSGLLDTTSVMMLTARSATRETLHALELGAIDFVSKPFSVPVLMERIENILERSS